MSAARHLFPRWAATGTAVALVAAVLVQTPAPARPSTAAAAGWQLRWSPDPAVDGLDAFEAVEDDRANSHPAGQPHIVAEGDHYRFTMHTVDRDISTDRQRQEVRGMRAGGQDLLLLKGERWRLTHSMFIPGSLKATTSFTHIMQTKAPGTGTLPMLVMSLRRQGSTPKLEFRATEGNVLVGAVDLAPLQNRWIDVEVEMTIGDAASGRVRWVIRNGTSTVIDVTRTVDTWLMDRVRPKWGIYRSLGDTSGSLQNCYLLIRNMRAYEWSASAAPPPFQRLEAEDATIGRGVVAANHPGFTGTGFVDLDDVAGSFVEWTVNSPAAGTAVLNLRYANGTTTDRPMDITVNGVLAADELAFPRTPAWDDWETRTIQVPLRAGTNRIRATATTAAGGPNLDNLVVRPPAGSPPPVNEYQAEDATISRGAVESNHTGFTGTGFVNYDNAAGSYVEWTVTAAATGPANLNLRYANGATTSRPMDITVNGTVVAAGRAFGATGNWDTWATVTVPVQLTAGTNTIRATATTAAGGPNVDELTIG
jgi:hypothetical protein